MPTPVQATVLPLPNGVYAAGFRFDGCKSNCNGDIVITVVAGKVAEIAVTPSDGEDAGQRVSIKESTSWRDGNDFYVRYQTTTGRGSRTITFRIDGGRPSGGSLQNDTSGKTGILTWK